jgi:ADP-ribose pyrophosphatase YjhB (NUDIX family)
LARFNLRVYALILNEFDQILLSDECRFGTFFTKFPGGGVEIGEGIKDALFRELQEELGLDLTDAEFFYVNEFHQASAFDQSNLVAFYYRIKLKRSILPFDETYPIPFAEEQEKQRWISLQELESNALTFPIDRIVLEKLKADFTS